jgi:hypothetical protein
MTDDMIERVARVLHLRSDHAPTWDDLGDYWQAEYMLDARAVIEAMREPTETMLADSVYFTGDPVVSERSWQAMIDAAVGEKQ